MKDQVTLPGQEAEQSNVISMVAPRRPRRHEPPLSDKELIEIRQMMDHFGIISTQCPVAIRVLLDAEMAKNKK